MSSKYLLVSWQMLTVLLGVCRNEGCGASVLPENIKTCVEGTWFTQNTSHLLICLGAAVTAKVTCNSGHETSWCSSDSIQTPRKAVKTVNLLLVLYTLLSGLHYQQLQVHKYHIYQKAKNNYS